ncbi:MAG TPA: tetratricopeptide repeat protein [Candidatus Sulfotelmatobacter sp.]|nr:tetratricopeptide repeat protein [Candidatus Sulfotelmatobacter sp.]
MISALTNGMRKERRSLICALVIVAAMGHQGSAQVAAGPALSAEAVQHWNAGRQAESQKDFGLAVSEYKKVTELAPTFAGGFVGLGQAFMEQRNFAASIPPLKRALELDSNLAPAHQLLGYSLLAEGYAREAIPHLERSEERGALGIAQVETSQFAEAITNLQAGLQKRPNDPDLLYYLGRASGLLSKQAIDTLLAAYPDSARAHQSMAENYFVLRQMPEAEKEYKQALEQRPDTPNLHLELGQVFAMSSRWPQAEEQFRSECKMQPGNAEAAYRLGDSLLQQGKTKEALIELERSDKLQPQMPETLYALGKSEWLDGNVSGAEKSWTQLLSIEQEGELAAQTHFALAALYRKQGKSTEAAHEMELFQKLKQSAPAQPATPQ